jgi:hypothetical protein
MNEFRWPVTDINTPPISFAFCLLEQGLMETRDETKALMARSVSTICWVDHNFNIALLRCARRINM